MKATLLWLLGAVVGLSSGQVSGRAPVDDFDAFFKAEFNKLALDFQNKLHAEVSLLKDDMFREVAEVVAMVEGARTSIAEDLSSKLDLQIADIFYKFEKVTTYSSLQMETLHAKIREVMEAVGWTNDGSDDLDPVVALSHDGSLEEYGDRRRRGVESSEDEFTDLTLDDMVDMDTLRSFDDMVIPESEERLQNDLLFSLDPHDHYLIQVDNRDMLSFALSSEDDLLSPPSLSLHRQQYMVERTYHQNDFVIQEVHPAENHLPRDCHDLLAAGFSEDGVYIIYPGETGVGVRVWCDQSSVGGGWTLVVSRPPLHPYTRTPNYTRGLQHYVTSFGRPEGDYWLGLAPLHQLTSARPHTLRVTLLDPGLHTATAIYHTFRVSGAEDQYRLLVGDYDDVASTAGDALTPHSGAPFTCPSRLGNENTGSECSATHGVGWWYMPAPHCYQALPTGTPAPPSLPHPHVHLGLGEGPRVEESRGTMMWRSIREREMEDWGEERQDGHHLAGIVMMVRPTQL